MSSKQQQLIMEAPSTTRLQKSLQLDRKKLNLFQLQLKYSVQLNLSAQGSASSDIKNFYHCQTYKNQLHIYDNINSSFHSINLQNKSIVTDELRKNQNTSFDKNLIGYNIINSTMINDEIYFLCKNDSSNNQKMELVKYHVYSGIYQKILTSESESEGIQVRKGPLMEQLSNMYILVYGGYNQGEQSDGETDSSTVYSDAYLYVFNKINKLKTIDPIQPRYKFASCQNGRKLYLFGGQTKNSSNSDSQITYFNDLYEISINDVNLQMKFTQLHSTTASPKPRSGHAITSISQRYLVLYGGQTSSNYSDKPKILNDFWIYDLQQKQWHQISIKGLNNLFNTSIKRNISLTTCNHSLYLFSNISSQNSTYSSNSEDKNKSFKSPILCRFEFSQSQTFNPQQTNGYIRIDSNNSTMNQSALQDQQSSIQSSQKSLIGKQFELTNTYLHLSSLSSIKFPFQAIQKLIEFGQTLKPKQIKIYSQSTTNTIEKYMFLSIDIIEPRQLKKNLFLESHSQENLQNGRNNRNQNGNHMEIQQGHAISQVYNSQQWSQQLLNLFCLRLGKTILYIQQDEKTFLRTVSLISVDNRFAPLVQRMKISFTYQQNYKTGQIQTKNYIRNKQLIIRILSSLVQNPLQLIRSSISPTKDNNNISGFKIMIFSPNIIPTVKTYYYEIIFDSLTDITLFKNNKKIQFLQKAGYNLISTMEFSLDKYLKYRKSKISQKRNGNGKSVSMTKQKRNSKKQQKRSKQQNEGTQEPLIYLSSSSQPISSTLKKNNSIKSTYINYLDLFEQEGNLTQLELYNHKIPYIQFIKLYTCHNNFILPENNGILLYQSGKLINRYQCQFGKLISEKFSKKFNSKLQLENVFNVVGQIHLTQDIQLIKFGTDFKHNKNYFIWKIALEKAIRSVLSKLQPKLKQFAHEKFQRNLRDNLRSEKIQKNQKSSSNQIVNHVQNIKAVSVQNGASNGSSSHNIKEPKPNLLTSINNSKKSSSQKKISQPQKDVDLNIKKSEQDNKNPNPLIQNPTKPISLSSPFHYLNNYPSTLTSQQLQNVPKPFLLKQTIQNLQSFNYRQNDDTLKIKPFNLIKTNKKIKDKSQDNIQQEYRQQVSSTSKKNLHLNLRLQNFQQNNQYELKRIFEQKLQKKLRKSLNKKNSSKQQKQKKKSQKLSKKLNNSNEQQQQLLPKEKYQQNDFKSQNRVLIEEDDNLMIQQVQPNFQNNRGFDNGEKLQLIKQNGAEYDKNMNSKKQDENAQQFNRNNQSAYYQQNVINPGSSQSHNKGEEKMVEEQQQQEVQIQVQYQERQKPSQQQLQLPEHYQQAIGFVNQKPSNLSSQHQEINQRSLFGAINLNQGSYQHNFASNHNSNANDANSNNYWNQSNQINNNNFNYSNSNNFSYGNNVNEINKSINEDRDQFKDENPNEESKSINQRKVFGFDKQQNN